MFMLMEFFILYKKKKQNNVRSRNFFVYRKCAFDVGATYLKSYNRKSKQFISMFKSRTSSWL